MSLREEIAGMRVRTYKNHVGDDLADEIINKVLDAAVEAAKSERLVEETGSPEDLAYDNAIFHVVEAIQKLRGE